MGEDPCGGGDFFAVVFLECSGDCEEEGVEEAKEKTDGDGVGKIVAGNDD